MWKSSGEPEAKEHRCTTSLSSAGEGLGGNVADTDPQKTGVPPLDPHRTMRPAEMTQIAKEFVAQATKLLAGQPKANGLTMRGFANAPDLPSYEDVYGLKAAAIAVYPMYKGLAQLVQAWKQVGKPATLGEEVNVLEKVNKRDFFFLHFNTATAAARTATSPRR